MHLTRDGGGGRIASAFVRHVHHLDSGHRLENLRREIARRSQTGVCIDEVIRFGFGKRNQRFILYLIHYMITNQLKKFSSMLFSINAHLKQLVAWWGNAV